MPLKHLSEYRDPELARKLISAIHRHAGKPIRIMEVCGTHTVSIFRHGLRPMLPSTLNLVSGPGCPVCVTAPEDIDRALKLAGYPGVILTTFGDLVRVPGSRSSLEAERAAGADIRTVYSTFDALAVAREHPQKEVVFLAIGFETTAPTVAAAVLEAHRTGLENFSVLSLHKLLPPALRCLLENNDLDLQGFLYPGHVTTVIGVSAYEDIARRYGLPGVVCGFEPVDILESLLLLVQMIGQGRAAVEIQYRRGATARGNPKAMEMIQKVFTSCNAWWRGLGEIPDSGLALAEPYRSLAAEARFDLKVPPAREPAGCACGEVLRGIKTPLDCSLFRTVCRPDSPVGPCMVSSEGTCAAYHRYGPPETAG